MEKKYQDLIIKLKKALVNSKVGRNLAVIPQGHCPTAYFNIEFESGCGKKDITCEQCKRNFAEALSKVIEQEVEQEFPMPTKER